jgi:4-carboxymuconolactone decarboxylase
MPARIAPLSPPFTPDVEAHLRALMPSWSKEPPLALFRIWARHLPLAESLQAVGSYILGRGTVEPGDREILILRVCARCGAEYEWGVHAVSFPPRLGMPEAVVAATARAAADDPVWSARQALLIRLADELHDTARVSDALWTELSQHWSEAQILELLLIVGFYHFVSFTVNAVGVGGEPWAARFPPTMKPPGGSGDTP